MTTEKTEYDYAMDEFFNKNYAMILATFLQENHDEFMAHAEEMYADHKGKEMTFEWSKK